MTVKSRKEAQQEIGKLVRFFEKNIHQLKSASFNETQARQQLIDPLFEALGWDVHNRGMRPLYLQEVVPEGRVKTNIGKEVKEQQALFEAKATLGKAHREYSSILDYIAEDSYKANAKEAIKKPDYRFRIKGQTKFFVEAKKPFVDLSKSAEAIFQVKRYGFSGRVPVSILTDFEEFRTFDCTHKPQYDKPKLGIIKQLDLTYPQYVDEFDLLYDTFSREAIEAGSLDTLTRKLLQKKTGDFALDKHFLEDLSKWREELARDIAKHPRNRRRLNDFTLNESVQRILDRIIFFRVCEDREIEVENTLLAILQMWQGRPGMSLYSLLNKLFKERRALYNGLLFAPHECEELEVGDEVLIKVLEGLNYPFSPYYFNEIGVEILGSIYEKFLGKTIRLTAKTVRVEEKPEVRKAGGVYYTPQYIVNYIVENTVGKLIEGRSPKQVAKLKIIDIACGSGSFLLGAFQKLMEYHIQWYQEHPKDIQTVNNVPDAYKDADGNLHLSARKKRDILVNNIYGVDIDRQAVEVTQMSLYLKVLEGENAETLNPQMTLALKEVYLPELTANIKCGNSLIGTDFTSQGSLFDDDAIRKVNPFDWEVEFPEIMNPSTGSGGGFDAVIGNPPYGADFSEHEKRYITEKYKTYKYKYDSYHYFIEGALNVCRRNGLVSYITPEIWLMLDNCTPLREHLFRIGRLEQIRLFGENVFEDAVVNTIVFIARKGQYNDKILIESELDSWSIPFERIQSNDKFRIEYRFKPFQMDLLDKIRNKRTKALAEFGDIVQGITAYDKYKGHTKEQIKNRVFHSKKKSGKAYGKWLAGGDVSRYSIDWSGEWLKYGPWLGASRDPRYFNGPRMLLREVPGANKRIQAAYADGVLYHGHSVTPFLPFELHKTSLKFLLALINSKLLSWYAAAAFSNYGKDIFPKLNPQDIKLLPIHIVDPNKSSEKKIYDTLINLSDKMIALNEHLQSSEFASQREPIERQIAATDKKIDELVYKLYGLTEEEIKIVEGRA